jgi:two-component system, OmpR family, alkaline phosphatase synthesis response regulator PhoP
LAKAQILVVDDEENILEAVRYNLEAEGYETLTATDGLAGLQLARMHHPDLVILDVMLPGMDGLEVCREIRRDRDVPIMMLSARGEELDRVVGLEVGADDYVTKPFSMRELMARVKVHVRRSQANAPAPTTGTDSASSPPLVSGDLELDSDGHRVRLAGAELELRPREFRLLELFMQRPDRALTRDQILEALWAHDYIGDARTVDVHVRWLREKIEADPAKPSRIVTVRGVGYRFEG